MKAWVIARREIVAWFTTPIGWLMLCGWLFLTGLFWWINLVNYVTLVQELPPSPFGGGPEVTIDDMLVLPFFGTAMVLLAFVVPALTMRLLADEVRRHTIDLLLTSPVTALDIVGGKFLGAWIVLTGLVVGTVPYALGIAGGADLDPGQLVAAYLTLWLHSGLLVAIGLCCSAFTSSQLVASLFTFAIAIGLQVIGNFGPGHPLTQLSTVTHAEAGFEGALRLSDVTYFIAFGAVWFFAALQRVEAFRWR
ncbi:MAG: ABC transporter permease subunit [Myxococcota bacterium]